MSMKLPTRRVVEADSTNLVEKLADSTSKVIQQWVDAYRVERPSNPVLQRANARIQFNKLFK